MRGERIPTPVTRSLARNDRNRRRDTRVPPYRVRRFTGWTESSAPTKSVIARSAATRQSVLPSPKRRIPTPVTRSLARNDRNRRRDTRVPPYRVRRFTGWTESSAPTKSVIARSAATRQSVLPSPKRRIPTPVTRSLARNDRNRRRDTRVPPYRVRRFTGRTESSAPTGGAPQPYTCTQKKSCPRAALFDLVISGVRLRSSPAPS